MILSIYHERQLTFEQVKKSILDLFPDYVIFDEDPKTGYPSDDMNWNRLDHAWIQLYFSEECKDFKYEISFQTGAKKEYDQKQSLHIARKISDDYAMRTITHYTNNELEEDPNGLCIVFDQGRTYLADDYWDSPMVGKTEAEGIRIYREFEIPRHLFDSTGDCIGVITD